MELGFQRSKLSLCIGMVITTGYHNAANAQTHSEATIEEVVVTSAFQTSEAETAMPVGILTAEELREKVGNSLGATLQNEIGVAIGSFGTGVGQPIIRGQSANRVKILENNVDVVDVAAQSADHANAAEPLLAERIEVVRGPATLLYGSGAIGGVVNVIDNRIPSALVESTEFAIEQSHNSVNDEDKTVFRLDAALGSFGLHLDGFTRESNNVRINGFAINEEGRESLEEHIEQTLGLAHGGHDEDHDEDHGDPDDDHDAHQEYENTNGFIGNSDSKASGFNAGLSYVGDRGFLGFSVSELNNQYGLPPGSHSHSLHDEDHEDKHDDHDDDHDEHGDEDHHDEHGEVEFVRLDLERTRYDIKGGYDLDGGFFTRLDGSVALTDYQHGEIEYFEDGDVEVGTLFESEGYTSRFTLQHAPVADWAGVWGLQLTDIDFSAVGEEAFVPRSDISTYGLFALERFEADNYIVELGARFENSDINAGLPCSFDDSAASASGSFLYNLNSDSNFMISVARSQRTPQVEELYANGANIEDACSQGLVDDHHDAHDEDHHDDHDRELVVHAATNLIEIGNANLDLETSNNLELAYRKHSGPWTGEVSVYRNEIDDFIYLDITGEEVAEQSIARYTARDATFNGFEAKFSYALFDNGSNRAAVSVFGDLVKAEFDGGENVPRVPPAKVGAEVRFSGADWTGHIHVTRHGEQDDPGRLELSTPGYTLLSAYADYHIGLGSESELKLFIRGDNLLDEEVRTHSSLLKDFSPEPGRAISLGLRFEM
jgi:iron complex outermembrane recepter protein